MTVFIIFILKATKKEGAFYEYFVLKNIKDDYENLSQKKITLSELPFKFNITEKCINSIMNKSTEDLNDKEVNKILEIEKQLLLESIDVTAKQLEEMQTESKTVHKIINMFEDILQIKKLVEKTIRNFIQLHGHKIKEKVAIEIESVMVSFSHEITQKSIFKLKENMKEIIIDVLEDLLYNLNRKEYKTFIDKIDKSLDVVLQSKCTKNEIMKEIIETIELTCKSVLVVRELGFGTKKKLQEELKEELTKEVSIFQTEIENLQTQINSALDKTVKHSLLNKTKKVKHFRKRYLEEIENKIEEALLILQQKKNKNIEAFPDKSQKENIEKYKDYFLSMILKKKISNLAESLILKAVKEFEVEIHKQTKEMARPTTEVAKSIIEDKFTLDNRNKVKDLIKSIMSDSIFINIIEDFMKCEKKTVANEHNKLDQMIVSPSVTRKEDTRTENIKLSDLKYAHENMQKALDSERREFLLKKCKRPANDLFLFSLITCKFSMAKVFWQEANVSINFYL